MSDPSINQAGGVTATSGLQITDNMDLDTIFMVLALDRSQTMDKVIADMAQDMKATNDRINKLNEAMSVVRSIRPDKKADESGKATLTTEQREALLVLQEEGVAIPSALATTTENHLLTGKGDEYEQIALEMSDAQAAIAAHENGTKTLTPAELATQKANLADAEERLAAIFPPAYTSFEGKPGAFDSLVENIKTKIDSLSSNSQLDMIKLQGMINKRNQVIEMASNVMQKIANSLNNLISNLR